MMCANCGHGLALHGRRGHGGCRHGRYGGLAAAVDAARAAVVRGLNEAERAGIIDAAFTNKPCSCRRYRVSPAPADGEERS